MTVERTYSRDLIEPAVEFMLGKDHTIDVQGWIDNPKHIVLLNDKGDLALFEPGVKHIYSGHYFFKSRGKEAIKSAKEFLDTLFNTCYNIDMVMGLVPVEKLGAKWITRRLGFTSCGPIEHNGLHYEQFILTKKEFNG
jgi:hypothetical protein